MIENSTRYMHPPEEHPTTNAERLENVRKLEEQLAQESLAYVLPAEIREALLRYLIARPYLEVAEGIAMLQNLLPLSRPEAEQDRHSVERLGE